MTVVGVVSHTAHEALDGPRRIQYYFPYAQRPSRNVVMAIGTRGNPSNALPAVRAAIRDMDPDLPLAAVTTMDTMIESSIAQKRLATALLMAFAAVATALACLGVYGNLAYMVARRARELGIRRALGSEPTALVMGVLRETFARVGPGLVAGFVLGIGIGQLARSQLYGVSPLDPQVLLGAALFLTLVALASALVPARRSMRADPLVVLRSE
jgi:ABC-type antimicrobial peptide transport system permease subunit